MNQRLQELSYELLSLPAQSRAFLAACLIESLDEAEEDDNYDQMWMQEINRRVAEIHEGKAEFRSVKDVIQEIKAGLGQ